MSTRAEPQRRRLTVSRDLGPEQAGSASGSGAAEGPTSPLIKLLIEQEKDAIGISAKNATKGKDQKEFSEKPVEVFGTGKHQALGEGREDEYRKAFCDNAGTIPAIDAIAYRCHKGKKPESPNQDSFSILLVEGDFALYCVYDGHGPYGHDASELVRNQLPAEFYARFLQDGDIENALKHAFATTQEKMIQAEGHFDMSGTTCTVVYHDFKAEKLTIAHVGDSRAVIGVHRDREMLCRVKLKDHKPDLPEEKAYIESHSGRVVFDGFYNHRVFALDGPYPGLNMSRALGDVVGHKKAGLRAEPDIQEVSIADLKKDADGEKVLLLLCTDGVWEFFDKNEEALEHITVDNAAPATSDALSDKLGRLTKESYDRWMKDSENEISDDITSIAVIL